MARAASRTGRGTAAARRSQERAGQQEAQWAPAAPAAGQPVAPAGRAAGRARVARQPNRPAQRVKRLTSIGAASGSTYTGGRDSSMTDPRQIVPAPTGTGSSLVSASVTATESHRHTA